MKVKYLASAVLAAGLIGVMTPAPASAVPAAGLSTAVERPSGITEVARRGHRGVRVHRGHRWRGHGVRSYRYVRPHVRSYRYVYRPRIRPYVYYSRPYVSLRIGGSSCYWLKRKAVYTGSRYWWRRYNACRYGWY